jgi:hypothetical protein
MRVVIISVATRAVAELGFLLGSAYANGISVIVLGMGNVHMKPGAIEWETKIWIPRDWLRASLEDGSVQPDDLVLCVDAYDVMFRGGYKAMLEGYHKAGSPQIIMSGERWCFPDASHTHHFQQRIKAKYLGAAKSSTDKLAFAGSLTPDNGFYPYVNGGTWGGIAASLDKLLQTAPEVAKPGDDQLTWTILTKNYSQVHDIDIDYEHHLFACVNGDKDASILATQTPIVHFNGKIKRIMNRAFELWFPQLQHPKDYDCCKSAVPKSVSSVNVESLLATQQLPASIQSSALTTKHSDKSAPYTISTIVLGVVLGLTLVTIVCLSVMYNTTFKRTTQI